MSTKAFERLIREAMLSLPKHIRDKMDNVDIVIERRPSKLQLQKVGVKYGNYLLGLYQGIPATRWGRGFGGSLPDKITIFQEQIEGLGKSKEEIKEIIKNTVWHEIAHHFGFSEQKIRWLETKWRKKRNN